MAENGVIVGYVDNDFPIDADFSKPVWQSVDEIVIDQTWDGKSRFPEYATKIKILRSEKNIYFLFIASFVELAIDNEVVADEKGDYWGIWEKDVVEVFISSNRRKHVYYEFVVSPINQQIDISHSKSLFRKKISDTGYTSGWDSAALIHRDEKFYVVEIRIPLKAIGAKAKAGEICNFNMFRCAGNEMNRLYMAMNPTFTDTPNFHVRKYFSNLIFNRIEASSK